mmetsp:Transcript_24565/g.56663  ORF Transcript_24565/g.56663 Transcript_24565/m.56663 type:complete len:358 (-) Transcript_24565:37-1110(-)
MADARQGQTDEVSILEALLLQALERRDGHAGTRMASAHAAVAGTRSYVPPAQFDAAVANYSVQLQAWVNLQVDQRLNQVLGNLVNTEVAVHRQEMAASLAAGERLEIEMSAVTDAQAKLLTVIQHHDAAISELRLLSRDKMEVRSPFARDEAQVLVETSLAALRTEILAELTARVDASKLAARQLEEIDLARLREAQEVVGLMDSLRAELSALEAKLEENRREWRHQLEEVQIQVSRDQVALQQRLLAMVRTELTAAFRSEAAEISAFDQKLRHKIDVLAQSHMRESSSSRHDSLLAPAVASVKIGAPSVAESVALSSHFSPAAIYRSLLPTEPAVASDCRQGLVMEESQLLIQQRT